MGKRTIYEVLECSTLQELQREVESRINGLGAVLSGGVATAAVLKDPSSINCEIVQTFLQAVTYELGEDASDAAKHLVAATDEMIDHEVSKRMEGYKRFWNKATGKYEIDKGTKSEWICTEDELYDDVRRSVISDFKQ